MTRAEDVLAQALTTVGWIDTGYTEATDLQNAADIIAALPPDVVIVSVGEVAERLHEPVRCQSSANGCLQFVNHLVEARRLLGLSES